MGHHSSTNSQPFDTVLRPLTGYSLVSISCAIKTANHRDAALAMQQTVADFHHPAFKKEGGCCTQIRHLDKVPSHTELRMWFKALLQIATTKYAFNCNSRFIEFPLFTWNKVQSIGNCCSHTIAIFHNEMMATEATWVASHRGRWSLASTEIATSGFTKNWKRSLK